MMTVAGISETAHRCGSLPATVVRVFITAGFLLGVWLFAAELNSSANADTGTAVGKTSDTSCTTRCSEPAKITSGKKHLEEKNRNPEIEPVATQPSTAYGGIDSLSLDLPSEIDASKLFECASIDSEHTGSPLDHSYEDSPSAIDPGREKPTPDTGSVETPKKPESVSGDTPSADIDSAEKIPDHQAPELAQQSGGNTSSDSVVPHAIADATDFSNIEGNVESMVHTYLDVTQHKTNLSSEISNAASEDFTAVIKEQLLTGTESSDKKLGITIDVGSDIQGILTNTFDTVAVAIEPFINTRYAGEAEQNLATNALWSHFFLSVQQSSKPLAPSAADGTKSTDSDRVLSSPANPPTQETAKSPSPVSSSFAAPTRAETHPWISAQDTAERKNRSDDVSQDNAKDEQPPIAPITFGALTSASTVPQDGNGGNNGEQALQSSAPLLTQLYLIGLPHLYDMMKVGQDAGLPTTSPD